MSCSESTCNGTFRGPNSVAPETRGDKPSKRCYCIRCTPQCSLMTWYPQETPESIPLKTRRVSEKKRPRDGSSSPTPSASGSRVSFEHPPPKPGISPVQPPSLPLSPAQRRERRPRATVGTSSGALRGTPSSRGHCGAAHIATGSRPVTRSRHGAHVGPGASAADASYDQGARSSKYQRSDARTSGYQW